MIDFQKITGDEISELRKIVNRTVEKSPFEKYYLYTEDIDERLKLFVYCHRFLVTIYNLIDECDLRKAIDEEVKKTRDEYIKAQKILNAGTHFGASVREKKAIKLVNSKDVESMIDLFNILIERINILQASKLKGILLEGKSGEEYRKLFKQPSLKESETAEKSED